MRPAMFLKRESFVTSYTPGVNAPEQQRQIGDRHLHGAGFGRDTWKLENTTLEPLIKNRPAVVVPIQQLHSVAASIAKHKQMSAERIVAHFVTHDSSQAVERVMQIDRGRMKVDLHDRS